MWKIISYSDKYLTEMLQMTKEYYGEENDISNEDFVRHEYFSNPMGSAYIKLAYDTENSKMAGQYIVLPRDYSVNGKKCKGVLSLNTLTRTEYRGQKVFTKLAEAVYSDCKSEKVDFCYGVPNPNSFPGFIKKLSFLKIGEIPLYLKIQSPIRILMDKMHVPYKHSDYMEEDTFYNNSVQISEVTKSNVGCLEKFWDNVRKKYCVIGSRDVRYLTWRYLELPRREYKIFVAKKNEEVCGYIIGRITEVAGMRCGMIVDYLFLKGEVRIGELLLDRICKCFKKTKIGLVGCLMRSNTEEGKILRKRGFFNCPHKLLPQPFPIIYRSFDGMEDCKIKNFDDWFFTMGDYDVI